MKNKKLLMITSVITLVLVLIIILASTFGNSGVVIINFDTTNDAAIEIFKKDDTKKRVITITKPGEIKLKKGSYIGVVSGNQYQPHQQDFTVSDSVVTVEIIISYTDDRLFDITSREQTNIVNTLKKSLKGFNSATDSISYPKTYRLGDWASVVIQTSRAPADYYHVILKKENGNWRIMTRPEIVLSKINYPSIPEDVLRATNLIQSNNSQSDASTDMDDYTGDGVPPEELGL
jgi:hypothetical protein